MKKKLDLEQVVREIEKNTARIKKEDMLKESELVKLVKQQLPRLKPGMNTDTVFSILYLDTKFNGIVSSDGERHNFTYYYDLDPNHQLLLEPFFH